MSTIQPCSADDHPTGFARRRRSPSLSRTIWLSALVSAALSAGQIFAQTDIHDPALAPGFDILASDPFTGSVAASDDALGTFVNPAALGMARAFNGYFFHAHSDSSFDGDNGLLLSADHLGFGAEWKRFSPVPKYNRYTLAYGGEVHPGVYLGTSYQWLSSSDPHVDHLSFWDLGLMLRPSRFLSLGATVHGLNRPHFGGERIERAYRYGVAVRPMTNRLTLYADGIYDEDEDLDRQRNFIFGAEIEPLDGLLLRLAADEEGRASLGFEIGLSHVAAGTYNHFDEDQEYRGGTTYLRFTEERRRTILRRPNRFVELDLAGEILEERRGFSLSGRGDHTTTELLRFFRKAEDDPAVRGIILRLGGLRAGWATLEELRDALLGFRATGKTVVCYLEDSSFGPYYLASAADYIILNPDGFLLLFGLRMERIFVTGTLEKIGVDVDLTRVGRYKSAAEMVTRDSMSDEAREMSNWIIEDIYDHVVADIAEGRGLSPEQVRAAIDAAPLIAADILDYGLVDTLAYEDEIDEIARSVAGIGFSKTRPSEIMAAEYRYDWRPPPRIALVYATGMITSGKSGTDFLTGAKTMGAETIAEAIKEAREDRSIKAIVFRIDSGGGSGLASGIIRREVSRTIGVKPFIVSMSDVAGSGGYHIACPSDLIIADGNTITGSIGVISGKPTLKRLYNKLGITKDVVYRGKHARAISDYYRLTEEEMELLDQATRDMYWDFVRKVAEGRGMTPAQVDSIGEGRVFTGRQAHSNGLIDELGGLERAIAIAIERSGLARDAEVEVITYPKGRWPFLLGMAQSALSRTLGSLPIEALRESGTVETLSLLELLEEEPCLYLMPNTLEPE